MWAECKDGPWWFVEQGRVWLKRCHQPSGLGVVCDLWYKDNVILLTDVTPINLIEFFKTNLKRMIISSPL